jgi:hypothetical protein
LEKGYARTIICFASEAKEYARNLAIELWSIELKSKAEIRNSDKCQKKIDRREKNHKIPNA